VISAHLAPYGKLHMPLMTFCKKISPLYAPMLCSGTISALQSAFGVRNPGAGPPYAKDIADRRLAAAGSEQPYAQAAGKGQYGGDPVH
jgi:hypothetical protein